MQVTDRGYTTHEHLQAFNLINMNGRCYDPLIGRMLSADAVVQDASSTQGYNRYSYCFNNPLSLTDPTGLQAKGGEIFASLYLNREVGLKYYYAQYGDVDNIDSQFFGGHHAGLGASDGGALVSFAYDNHNNGANIVSDANGDLSFSLASAGVTTTYRLGFSDNDGAFGIVTGVRGNDVRALNPGGNGISAQNIDPNAEMNNPNADGMYASLNGGPDNIIGKANPAGTFNIYAAVNTLDQNAGPVSQHACARYLRYALESGFGLQIDAFKGIAPGAARLYGPFLEGLNFQTVDNNNYLPQIGDIRVFQPYVDGNPNGHIDMYNGTQWESDFREKNDFPGNGYKNSVFKIFRWTAHP